MSWTGRLLLAAAGALATGAATAALARAVAARSARPADHGPTAGGWTRPNHRGKQVSLVGGPALAAAASVTAAAGAATPASAVAALVAGVGAGGVGLYDDLVGARPEHRAKGFRGHLAALRQGRITSGLVKLAGASVAGLAAAALLEAGRPVAPYRLAFFRGKRATAGSTVPSFPETGHRLWSRGLPVLLGAGVIAGAANLTNLLDLRPGRALKVGLLVGVPLAAGPAGGLVAGPLGAATASLPGDLAEQTMLGDCGANALGALLGTALVARTGPAGRAAALVVIGGLTAASERVSFTQVIAGTPVLRWLDELGRSSPRQG